MPRQGKAFRTISAPEFEISPGFLIDNNRYGHRQTQNKQDQT
jgi:hypothetical protein